MQVLNLQEHAQVAERRCALQKAAIQDWRNKYAAATAPVSQRQPTPQQRQALLALRPQAQAEDWPVERYCNAVRSIMGLEPLDLHTDVGPLAGHVA
jgi:hypothetical protein